MELFLRAYFQDLGRRGGAKGGKAAARNMTPQQRVERAKKAVAARWEKAKERDLAKAKRAKKPKS